MVWAKPAIISPSAAIFSVWRMRSANICDWAWSLTTSADRDSRFAGKSAIFAPPGEALPALPDALPPAGRPEFAIHGTHGQPPGLDLPQCCTNAATSGPALDWSSLSLCFLHPEEYSRIGKSTHKPSYGKDQASANIGADLAGHARPSKPKLFLYLAKALLLHRVCVRLAVQRSRLSDILSENQDSKALADHPAYLKIHKTT